VGIIPLKHESPHEMGVKEIKVPSEGAEIGLNLEASVSLNRKAEGTGK
jgi:hypothetical protein